MEAIDKMIEEPDERSDSSSLSSLELIEVKESDPEFDREFEEKVLKIYLKELFRDLLNREVDANAKTLSFRVFSEVSRPSH